MLEANGKVNGIGEISHLYPIQNHWTNFDAVSTVSLRPSKESTSKIWFKSTQLLPLCACVKNGFWCGFFC